MGGDRRWGSNHDWPRAASTIARRAVLGRPPEREVYLDRSLLGQFAFWWDDQDDADDVLSELREALSLYLDEELQMEDW